MITKIKILFIIGMIPGALVVSIIGKLVGADLRVTVPIQFIALAIQLTAICIGWYYLRKERKKLEARIKEIDIEIETRRKELVDALYPISDKNVNH